MLIKLLLLGFVVVAAIYFLRAANHTRTQASKKILFSLFVVFMMVAIIFPDTTNRLADIVGVGRGADLLLYTLTVTFIFAVVNIYIKFKEYEQRINKLTRNIAISEAKNKKLSK